MITGTTPGGAAGWLGLASRGPNPTAARFQLCCSAVLVLLERGNSLLIKAAGGSARKGWRTSETFSGNLKWKPVT